jgi:hypothetical protein
VAPRVEITAAGGEVIVLDVPDDGFPDPGLLTDLGDGETGLLALGRQGVTDAHAHTPPLLVIALGAGRMTKCRGRRCGRRGSFCQYPHPVS